MSNEIKQDELYDDLSIMLVLIKKIFKNMLTNNPADDSFKTREGVNEETIITSRCTQLLIKYKKIIIKKNELVNIINRFMCRVKEILKQINHCVPKEKIQIVIILKKMELLALKTITVENSASIIYSMLEFIANCNIKMIHALKIKPPQSAKEHRQIERLIQKQSSYKQQASQQKYGKIQTKQTDLQLMTQNLERYSVLGIDKEYFRCRYFDLKSQDNSVYQEIMFRNRNIRNLMGQYEKDYKKFMVKSSPTYSPSKSSKQNIKKRVICWQITPSEPQNSNLFHTKKEVSSRSSSSQKITNNKSNQIITYNSLEYSAEHGIQTYRSMYESKMMKSRNKKTVKMTNTIIDVPSPIVNPNAHIINAKRWNFYKKSQQHLKFRYKYSQNKNYNTTPVRNQYGDVNPQLFYTINK